MAFDYAKTAGQILEMVGGKANVEGLTHCITRLRFMLKDMGLPKDSEVEKIPGVLRVIKQGGQYQVVIGNEVTHVFAELQKLGDFSEGGKRRSKGKPVFQALRFCGGLHDAPSSGHAGMRYD